MGNVWKGDQKELEILKACINDVKGKGVKWKKVREKKKNVY